MEFIYAEKRIQSTIKYQRLETFLVYLLIYSYTMMLKIEDITVPDVIHCVLRQTAP